MLIHHYLRVKNVSWSYTLLRSTSNIQHALNIYNEDKFLIEYTYSLAFSRSIDNLIHFFLIGLTVCFEKGKELFTFMIICIYCHIDKPGGIWLRDIVYTRCPIINLTLKMRAIVPENCAARLAQMIH